MVKMYYSLLVGKYVLSIYNLENYIIPKTAISQKYEISYVVKLLLSYIFMFRTDIFK